MQIYMSRFHSKYTFLTIVNETDAFVTELGSPLFIIKMNGIALLYSTTDCKSYMVGYQVQRSARRLKDDSIGYPKLLAQNFYFPALLSGDCAYVSCDPHHMSPIHSHSFTLSVGLYLSISLRLSLLFIACGNGWTMDRLRSVRRLSLNMSVRSLVSRLGLSTLVGSNFGQTTVALV